MLRRLLHYTEGMERLVRRWRGKKQAARTIKDKPGPLRLHVGCGTVRFTDWIHLDDDPRLENLDVRWNIDWGLPFPDEVFDTIYSEHMLEHLAVERGVRFLAECRRTLKVGGILRTAMPSLEALLQSATAPDWKAGQDWLTWPAYQFIQTRAEMVNISFRWWGHQWIYDREELHRRLLEAGFSEMVDCEWQKSVHPSLCGRETRKDSLLICEAKRT